MVVVPSEKLAVHFHAPRDNASPLFWSLSSTAIIAWSMGLGSVVLFLFHVPRVLATRQPMGQVWSSVAGLGGCRYTTGASGNVATEDAVLHAQWIRYQTNVDMGKLMAAKLLL